MLPRTACYLLLVIPSQAYFLGAPRLPLAQRRTPLVTLCSEALLGGIPAVVDDAILARDEASDAWWRASVRAVRGSQVLVHYSGCDDSWDEWVEASSPNLVRAVALLAVLGVLVCTFAAMVRGRPLEESTAVERIDAILVLAGGVTERGEPLETVKRRLRLAAEDRCLG